MAKRLMALAATVAAMVPMTMSASAFAAAGEHPYVVLGDSVPAGFGASAPSKGFVGLLYSEYSGSLGADRLLNHAVPGATSEAVRGNQLSQAVADINDPSDTVAVTVAMGGNDAILGVCSGDWASGCPFRSNFATTIGTLKEALGSDPGEEKFTVMAYYNPATGRGDSTEAKYAAELLGSDGKVDCAGKGAALGLNDVIYREAFAEGIPVGDPFDAFTTAGQSYIAGDGLHPNDGGHAALARALDAAKVSCPDSEAPKTRVPGGPPDKTRSRSATFRFFSDDRTATFRCKLDGKAWTKCKAPKTYKNLKPGQHTFRVYAVDPSDNADKTAAKRVWFVLPPKN